MTNTTPHDDDATPATPNSPAPAAEAAESERENETRTVEPLDQSVRGRRTRGGADPAAQATQHTRPPRISPAPSLAYVPRHRPNDESDGSENGSPRIVRWVLTDDDGGRFPVIGDTVIGRQPFEFSEAEGIAGVAISDPMRSVSRVHLRASPEGGRVLRVRDMGSSNGTYVQRGSAYIEASGTTGAALHDGEILWVGERRFTVRVDQ